MEAAKTIEISHATSTDVLEFRHAINQAFQTIQDMYNVTGLWVSDLVYEIQGTSIQGTVCLASGKVIVKPPLGLLLIPFASSIESMIGTALKDRLK
jgi:hypothetical protein